MATRGVTIVLPVYGAAQQLRGCLHALERTIDARVPVLLAVFAELPKLAAVDRDFDRYPFAGGASVYPFVWSILLAAHAEGLGGVMTTMLVRAESEVKRLLGAPEHWALATVVALGRPAHPRKRLRRRPVHSFTTVDRADGPVFDTTQEGRP